MLLGQRAVEFRGWHQGLSFVVLGLLGLCVECEVVAVPQKSLAEHMQPWTP